MRIKDCASLTILLENFLRAPPTGEPMQMPDDLFITSLTVDARELATDEMYSSLWDTVHIQLKVRKENNGLRRNDLLRDCE